MSSTQTVTAPKTAAVAASAVDSSFDASAYADVTVFATNLAGAETVDVLLGGGNAAVAVTKSDGTALVLTAASPSALLPGGPLYLFAKSVTVGLSGIYAAPRKL